MDEIVKYELSDDGKGLKAFSSDRSFYHIYRKEMTTLEKWIHDLLLRFEEKDALCKLLYIENKKML